MDQPIVQGLLTFLGGAVVAGLNALLSARLLEKSLRLSLRSPQYGSCSMLPILFWFSLVRALSAGTLRRRSSARRSV